MDRFCAEHLSLEYAEMCSDALSEMRLEPSQPLMKANVQSWACGIVRAICSVNFVDDPSNVNHVTSAVINKSFGVSNATAAAKLKIVRETLDLWAAHPEWTVMSQLDNNPFVLILTSNGVAFDVRQAPHHVQDAAYDDGLIPYVPYEQNQKQAKEASKPKKAQPNKRRLGKKKEPADLEVNRHSKPDIVVRSSEHN